MTCHADFLLRLEMRRGLARRVNLGLLDNLAVVGPPMPAVFDIACNGWWPDRFFDRRICVQCGDPFTTCRFIAAVRRLPKRSASNSAFSPRSNSLLTS